MKLENVLHKEGIAELVELQKRNAYVLETIEAELDSLIMQRGIEVTTVNHYPEIVSMGYHASRDEGQMAVIYTCPDRLGRGRKLMRLITKAHELGHVLDREQNPGDRSWIAAQEYRAWYYGFDALQAAGIGRIDGNPWPLFFAMMEGALGGYYDFCGLDPEDVTRDVERLREEKLGGIYV